MKKLNFILIGTIFLTLSFYLLSCTNTKTKDETTTGIATNAESTGSTKLTDESALKAANIVASREGFQIKEWLGLYQITDYEIQGKAYIQIQQQPNVIGEFIFRKSNKSYWVVDEFHFLGRPGYSDKIGFTFQKVE